MCRAKIWMNLELWNRKIVFYSYFIFFILVAGCCYNDTEWIKSFLVELSVCVCGGNVDSGVSHHLNDQSNFENLWHLDSLKCFHFLKWVNMEAAITTTWSLIRTIVSVFGRKMHLLCHWTIEIVFNWMNAAVRIFVYWYLQNISAEIKATWWRWAMTLTIWRQKTRMENVNFEFVGERCFCKGTYILTHGAMKDLRLFIDDEGSQRMYLAFRENNMERTDCTIWARFLVFRRSIAIISIKAGWSYVRMWFTQLRKEIFLALQWHIPYSWWNRILFLWLESECLRRKSNNFDT